MRLTANEVRGKTLRRFKSSRLRKQIKPTFWWVYLFDVMDGEDLGAEQQRKSVACVGGKRVDGSSRLRK